MSPEEKRRVGRPTGEPTKHVRIPVRGKKVARAIINFCLQRAQERFDEVPGFKGQRSKYNISLTDVSVDELGNLLVQATATHQRTGGELIETILIK